MPPFTVSRASVLDGLHWTGCDSMIGGRIGIWFFISTLRRTGPNRHLLNIVQHLDRDRFVPNVLTLSATPEDSIRSELGELDVICRSLDLSRWQSTVKRDWAHTLASIRGPADEIIIHSQGIRADAVSSRWLKALPRISTVHNYPYHDYVMKYGLVLGRYMAATHLRSLRKLPRVVGCSSTVSRYARLHGVSSVTIRNGVPVDELAPTTAEERQRLRRNLHIDAGALVFISVGALIKRKNPCMILQAFQRLKNEEIRLIMVGSGTEEGACFKCAGGDRRITFTGQVSNTADYLHCADLFVSASQSEGMPYAVLEAMACGLPVFLSDIPSHREILDLAPQAGWLFQLHDVEGLRTRIERIGLHGDHGSAAKHAREAACLHFNAATMSRAYQGEYARLVGAGEPMS